MPTRFSVPDLSAWPAAAVAAALFGLLYARVLFAPSGHAPATHDSDFYMY